MPEVRVWTPVSTHQRCGLRSHVGSGRSKATELLCEPPTKEMKIEVLENDAFQAYPLTAVIDGLYVASLRSSQQGVFASSLTW